MFKIQVIVWVEYITGNPLLRKQNEGVEWKPQEGQRLGRLLALFYEQVVHEQKIEDSERLALPSKHLKQEGTDLRRLGNVELTYGMDLEELVSLFLLPHMREMLQRDFPKIGEQLIDLLRLYPHKLLCHQYDWLISTLDSLIQSKESEMNDEEETEARF